MPQYQLPAQKQANTYDNEAAAVFQAGNSAATTGDNYVRITVFLAAVLFLVGIGSTFKLHVVRYALVAFGSVLSACGNHLMARSRLLARAASMNAGIAFSASMRSGVISGFMGSRPALAVRAS